MVHGDGMMDLGHLILGALMMFTVLRMLGWHSYNEDEWRAGRHHHYEDDE